MGLFHVGQLFITPGAIDCCTNNGVEVHVLLARHLKGDWGDVDPSDKAANDKAIHDGTRIFSAYQFAAGKVWIITEADRSSTTILLPEEY